VNVPPKAVNGWFCDIDEDDFAAENKVRIYPGKWNVWLLARRKGEGSTIEEIVEDKIIDPLDTSWVNDNVAVVSKKLESNTPDHVRIAMMVYGRHPQQKSMSKLTHPASVGSNIDFYVVNFLPPDDAPQYLPWPVEGCPEEADWLLSGALSDVVIATGKPEASPSEGGPVTAKSAEAQRKASLDALKQGQMLSPRSEGMSWTTKLMIGAAVFGGAYFYARNKGLLPQR
jgi:hypothetical protein